MKFTTVAIGTCWALFGAFVMVGGLTCTPAPGEGSWAEVCWFEALGILSLVGAIALFARRAFGWWMIVCLSGLAVVFMAVAFAREYGEPGGRELPLFPALAVAFLVLIVGLLHDRPSQWANRAPEAES